MKYQNLFKTLIRSRFLGMYWRAHKTATLTLIQHTVGGGGRFYNMPNQIHMYFYPHLVWKCSTGPVTQAVFCSFNNHCSVINHSDTFSLQCSWLKRVWILICYVLEKKLALCKESRLCLKNKNLPNNLMKRHLQEKIV